MIEKRFDITYVDPATGVTEKVTESFSDTAGITAREWAEDYGYSLADKGFYFVTELRS